MEEEEEKGQGLHEPADRLLGGGMDMHVWMATDPTLAQLDMKRVTRASIYRNHGSC